MYSDLYNLIEARLKDVGLSNVGPALSGGRPVPSVEPWIAQSVKPDPSVVMAGGPGDPRKIFLGVKITVAKSNADGGAQLQGLQLLDQAESALKTWVMPVVGIIRAGDKRRRDSPQLVQEDSGVKEFNSDGQGVWVSLFSVHLYVDKFEVKS